MAKGRLTGHTLGGKGGAPRLWELRLLVETKTASTFTGSSIYIYEDHIRHAAGATPRAGMHFEYEGSASNPRLQRLYADEKIGPDPAPAPSLHASPYGTASTPPTIARAPTSLDEKAAPDPTTLLLKKVAEDCVKSRGTLVCEYNQTVQEAGAALGGGACFGLVQTWMMHIATHGPSKSETCLPFKARRVTEVYNAVIERQLVSYALVARANDYTTGGWLNPFKTLKSKNIAAANADLKDQRLSINEQAISFVSDSGSADAYAVAKSDMPALKSMYKFEDADFKLMPSSERYVRYVCQCMAKSLGKHDVMHWLRAERPGVLGVMDASGALTTVVSAEEARERFHKKIRGTMEFFTQMMEKNAFVLVTGGVWKSEHAVGAYFDKARSEVYFFDPNFGIFRWAQKTAVGDFSVFFLAAICDRYDWQELLFFGFVDVGAA